MADLRLANKEFLAEFIAIYQAHPALWKTKSKDYVNRNLKNIGYDALIELYKKVDPNADRDVVAKKIQSMRGSFRKELKKYTKFMKSGTSCDEPYVPSLWYFDLLLFTRDQELSNDGDDSSATSATSEVEQFDDDSEIYQPDTDEDMDEQRSTHDAVAGAQQLSVATTSTIGARARKHGADVFKMPPTKKMRKQFTPTAVLSPEQANSMQACADALKDTTNHTATESDAFGRLVAAKHNKLTEEQRMYAELLITTILNKGILKKLTDHTVVTEKFVLPDGSSKDYCFVTNDNTTHASSRASGGENTPYDMSVMFHLHVKKSPQHDC